MLNSFFPGLLLALAWLAALSATSRAQIPAAPSPTSVVYRTRGTAEQPFSVEVIDVRRTTGQAITVRLTLTNEGRSPFAPRLEFAGNPPNPADENRLTGFYIVDPNGQKKYEILRDAAGVSQCSVIDPALAPGERREVRASFPAPPSTSNTLTLYFPKAEKALVGVPIGLSVAGEPVPANAPLPGPPTTATVQPTPPSVSASTPPAGNNPESNYKPNVYTNQLPGSEPAPTGTTKKTVGHVQASNSDVPFTVEVLALTRVSDTGFDLRLALTNNSSGPFDVGNYFTGGLTDSTNARRISGVYLVDPISQARFAVARDPQNHALCSEIDPPLGPGERREVSASLTGPAGKDKNGKLPANFYLYFPQTSPIPNVPVNP